MSAATTTCGACGAETPADNVFCGICGARLQEAPTDSLLGKVVAEKFRIVRLLGSGGMGAIYLAEHVGIGKRVAIKLLRADLRGHPHLVKRFRREAMAVSRLTDAHTITVFDFGVWDGVVYLVMEYLIGDDLSKTLAAESRLDPARALAIVHQICSSLAEAHAQGVVHRDLKPENVFLTRTTSGDEWVKVLDFGLAKILAPEGAEALLQTADGALMGTPYYMAPEQVKGEAVDARTDLYAVGGLLFRMLTGQVPYVGKSPLQVMEAHVSGALPRFDEVDPTLIVPPGLEELVRRLLARAPDDRPQSALAVDQEVVGLLDRISGPRGDLRSRPATPAPSVDPRAGGPADEGPDDAPRDTAEGSPEGARPTPPPTAPGRPSALTDGSLADGPPADGGPLSFDDAPDDGPRPRTDGYAVGAALADQGGGPPTGAVPFGGGLAGQPADPAANSWVLGDSAPPPSARPGARGGGRSMLPWVVVVLLAAGGGAAGYRWYAARSGPPTAEVEPNDTPATASPIADDLPLTGTIGPGDGATGDRDVFVIDVPPDRRHVRARVSGVDGLDLILEAVDYAGNSLFKRDARRVGRGEWGTARVDSDRLLIVVRARTPEGESPPSAEASYRLMVRFSDRPIRRRGRRGGDPEPEPEPDGGGAEADGAADARSVDGGG